MLLVRYRAEPAVFDRRFKRHWLTLTLIRHSSWAVITPASPSARADRAGTAIERVGVLRSEASGMMQRSN
jgi:hypothetical protein